MGSTRSETIGLRLIDVLVEAWVSPFSTKGDFARLHADFVAMAASDGMLTTKIAVGFYGRRWLITEKGLKHLRCLGVTDHDQS